MKVNVLRNTLESNGFLEYPPIVLIWEVTGGKDDIPVGPLEKRMKKITSSFDESWKLQLALMDKIKAFRYLENTVFNREGLSSTIKCFAEMNSAHKLLVKQIKFQKNVPEVKEYYSRFVEVINLNIFALMLEDFQSLRTLADSRSPINDSGMTEEEAPALFKEFEKSLK